MDKLFTKFQPKLYAKAYSKWQSPWDQFYTTFAPVYGAPLSTVVSSRRAYLIGLLGTDAITVSVGAEYSLDGITWTSDPGVWGDSSFIMVRGQSTSNYSEAVIYTVTIGVLELGFTIWTMDEPQVINASLWTDGDDWTDATIFEL